MSSLPEDFDVRAYNRSAWDKKVASKDPWTVPVSDETVSLARKGKWSIVLTPTKPVPSAWFPSLHGLQTLCLASGGGQQGPILAAAGAVVTVLDNSPRQLEQDRKLAERHGLDITTVEGDMMDLSMFDNDHFGLIVHPISNCFIPQVRTLWQEAFRVLQPGGILLAGFTNPVRYVFDQFAYDRGELEVCHSLPYSDLTNMPEQQRQQWIERGEPLEYGHTLEDQINGQTDAGFLLTGFYEDFCSPDDADPLSKFMPSFIATRAVKAC